MLQEELNAYISKRLKKGYPAGELRNELLEQGYAADIIDQAIDQTAAPEAHADRFGWKSVLVSILLIILGISQLNDSTNQSRHMIGIGTLITGIVGLVIKLIDQLRK